MTQLSEIVNVQISRDTRVVSRQGFGIGLVLAENISTFGSDLVRSYSSLAAVAEDFLTSDAAYKFAQKYFGGRLKPVTLLIGKRSAKVAQVVTMTPTLANTFTYVVTINGVEFEFISDADATAAEIVAGLIASINAGAEPVTASGTTTLVLTADVPGTSFSYVAGTNLTGVLTTPNNGVVEDLQAVDAVNSEWYVVALTSRNDADILNLAADIEAREAKKFFACSEDTAILASTQTDAFALLKARGYFNTLGLWSDDQENYPEAALMAETVTRTPGSYTAAYKPLTGNLPSKLTGTQETNLKGKNVNYYVTIAGNNVLLGEGKVAGGEYFDVMHFVDWLKVNAQADLFGNLINIAKIPYTDGGIAILEGALRARLQEGVAVGGLASFTVTALKRSEVPTNDRATRRYNGLSFTGQLAGAIHFVTVTGNVTP